MTNLKQIFSITTDNGANMLITVSILAKVDSEVSDENDFYDNFNKFDEYYENNEEKETCLDNNLLEELNQYPDSLAK